MGAGWTAGGVRARAILSRRVGVAGAREIAGSASLDGAVDRLRATPYGPALTAEPEREAVEWAIAATVLWHLRVLAGWQPRPGVAALRALAGWFEIANVVGHARALAGRAHRPPFRLGALAMGWPRLAATGSLVELHAALGRSGWRHHGTADPAPLATALQLTWADRVATDVPPARCWAVAGAALLLARSRFLEGHELDAAGGRHAASLLGRAAQAARSWPDYVAALPRDAGMLRALAGPDELWRAESRWWNEVEERAFALTRGPRFGLASLVGCAALLAVDGQRVQAALQIAARGGREREAFDAVC